MPHGASGSVHSPLTSLWIDHPHPNDSPQESLVRIGWLLSSEPFKFFVVEKGLHPKIVIHPQGLELLGQGEVCEDHVMDLVRIYSQYPRLHTLFRFLLTVSPPPDLNTSLNCSLCNPSNYAYPYYEGYVVLVYRQNTPKGPRTTSHNS